MKSERAGMPDDEKSKMEDRLVRAIKSGLPVWIARTRFNMHPDKIRAVCKRHGVAMPKTTQSKWFAPESHAKNAPLTGKRTPVARRS